VLRKTGQKAMAKLNIGIEIRDFDLERLGFSLSVLESAKQRQLSEGYLRMTLAELGVFVDALKAAPDIEVSTIESPGGGRLPGKQPRPAAVAD
jgi:hypothetical protein